MLTLLNDEHVIYRTKKHLIIFLTPAMWTIFSCILYVFMHNYAANTLNSSGVTSQFTSAATLVIVGGPLLVALFYWANQWLTYVTSVFIITDKRILMTEGFFLKHTNETRLATIAQVTVNQSLLGQLLNFGSIIINTYGGTNDGFHQIANPLQFQTLVNQQLENSLRK